MGLDGLALGVKPLLMIFALLVACVVLRYTTWQGSISRKGAIVTSPILIGLITVEYWIFGSSSFLDKTTDLLDALSVHLQLTHYHHGGQYSHASGGGFDAAGMNHNTGQLFSLERLIFGTLPLGPALIFHRWMTTSLAFLGMYLLCRRLGRADRLLALMAATAFAAGFWEILNSTVEQGLGYPLMPWLALAFVQRQGRRFYWQGVVLLSMLYAISSTPTHAAAGTATFVILTAISQGWRNFLRTLPALFVLIIFMVANWHDSLYAKYLTINETPRQAIGSELTSWEAFLTTSLRTPRDTLPFILGFPLVALLFWRYRAPIAAFGSLIAVVVIMLGGATLNLLPFESLGIGFLGKYNFNYIQHAIFPGVLLLFCLALARGRERTAPTGSASSALRQLPAAYLAVFVLAVMHVGWWKVRNAVLFLNGSSVATIEVMREAAQLIKAEKPSAFRVATIPFGYLANSAASAGLETMDGGYVLYSSRVTDFWKSAAPANSSLAMGFFPELVIWGCCKTLDFDSFARPGLLAQANIGFVLSAVPLKSAGLTRFGALNPDTPPPTNKEPLIQRYKAKAAFTWSPSLFIYSVDGMLGRAYGASELVQIDADADDHAVIEALAERAPAKVAFVQDMKGDVPGPVQAPLVSNIRYTRVGLDIDIQSEATGWVVVAVPFSKFWRANYDGNALEVQSANGFQMAVRVPPGRGTLSMIYNRPTLFGLTMADFLPSAKEARPD